MKQTMKLNENQLKQIIKESVKSVLKENNTFKYDKEISIIIPIARGVGVTEGVELLSKAELIVSSIQKHFAKAPQFNPKSNASKEIAFYKELQRLRFSIEHAKRSFEALTSCGYGDEDENYPD